MPSINGQELQHALIKLSMLVGAPLRVRTFSKLSFGATSEKKPVNDSQGQPIGWTQDVLKYDGGLTLLRSEWVETVKPQILQQNPGLGILQCRMDWDVTYGNSFVTYQTAKLYGVMFNADKFESENNQDPLMCDIPLFILGSEDESGRPPVVYT